MTRSRTRMHVWMWLAVIAFMATRLSGVHLHLCFDGSEPPAAVHTADGTVHADAHHRETRHVDKDVSVFDALLAKKDDSSTDLAAVSVGPLVILYISVLISKSTWPVSSAAIRPPPLQLRPPPRGPPR